MKKKHLSSTLLLFLLCLNISSSQAENINYYLAPITSVEDLFDPLIFNSQYILSPEYIKDHKAVKNIGKKAFTLSILSRNGAPVTHLFNITNDALDNFCNQNIAGTEISLSDKIKEITDQLTNKSTPLEIEEAAKNIENIIMKTPMQNEFKEQVTIALSYLHKKFGIDFFSVRSSSISLAEDSITNSLPGLFESELNQKGVEAILNSIKRVWISQWSKSAITHRLNNNISLDEVATGVIVQKQLDSIVSGVFYTQAIGTNPLDKIMTSELTVGRGLGKSIVEGQTTPDWFKIDRSGQVKNERLGNQKTFFVSKKDGGIKKKNFDNHNTFLLSKEKLKELNFEINKWILKLEKKTKRISPFGYDVEWAISEEGKIYIFQARPIAIPQTDPLKHIYLSLSRLSTNRDELLEILKVLSKEKIYSGTLEKIIPNLVSMIKRVENNTELTKDLEVIIKEINTKLHLESNFLSIIEFMESNYAMLQKTSTNELGDNSKLDAVFECYLNAMKKANFPSEDLVSLRMLKFKIDQVEDKVLIPEFKAAYYLMLRKMKLHSFRPNSLKVYFNSQDDYKDERFNKKSAELMENLVSSWDTIDSISVENILTTFDVLWDEYFKDHPESHKIFIKGIKVLFSNIDQDTKTLKKITKMNQNLILFPVILQSKFPELKGEILDLDVEEWMNNIKNDPRFTENISFDSFISYGFNILFLNSVNYYPHIERIANEFGIEYQILKKIIKYLLKNGMDDDKNALKARLEKEFTLKLNNEKFSAFTSKIKLYYQTSSDTASILESSVFLSNLTLSQLTNLTAYLFYQSENPALKDRIIKGIKNLVNSKKGIKPLFFKQIIDELIISDLSKIKLSKDFINKLRFHKSISEKITKASIDLSALSSDFKSLGEIMLNNKDTIQSNPFDLRDAIKFAINAAKTKNEKLLQFTLIAIKNIFINKGFHGTVWREGYDDAVRPKNPNLMPPQELSLIIGSTGEDLLDIMLDAFQRIHIDVPDHFHIIKEPLDELFTLLENNDSQDLLLSYYHHFIEFFNLPIKQGIDVDDSVSALNREVLRASYYSSQRKIRAAKRYFIEKASRYIPGSMNVDVNWREMHNDFENLHEYVKNDNDPLKKSLHLLRNNIHNILDHMVLDQAKEILKVVSDKNIKESSHELSTLKRKLIRLVSLLEKLYKPISEVNDDISHLLDVIPSDLEEKIEKIISKQISQEINNTLNITNFRSISHNLVKAENHIKKAVFFESLLEITSIRSIINILLSDLNINKKRGLLSAKERLALINLDISLERLESGIVSLIAKKQTFKFKDAVISVKWLYNIFNVCSDHFDNTTKIKKMIINLIDQLTLKNIIASAEIWSNIRKEISNIKNRRTILSFRLFEFAAQKLDAYFFEDAIIPISPGNAHGRARRFEYESEQELSRLINDDEHGLRPTEILVIRDIPRVIDISDEHIPSGIIIEEGSIGSHTSCAVRQGEKPIPTILVKDALKYIHENDLLGFQVSNDMKNVVLKTENLNLIEVTKKLKDYPQRIAPGWAEGNIKIIEPLDGDLTDCWKQAKVSRKDIVVLESFDGPHDIYHMITSYGIPAGIIVSKGSSLSYFRKILRRIVDQKKIEIPIIRIDDALTVFKPSKGIYYAISVRKNEVKLFKRLQKDLKIQDLKRSSNNINSLTKKDLIINPRIVISNINGNYSEFMKKKDYLDTMYPRHPLLYLGNVIGNKAGNIDLLEYIFEKIMSERKDILLLGKNEMLFLNCMRGDLNDLKLFMSKVGSAIFEEARIDCPHTGTEINEAFHNAIKQNSQLNNVYKLLLEHGKLYFIENDHAFFANELLFDNKLAIKGYSPADGSILYNQEAFDQMEIDLKLNPQYLLKQIKNGKSPINLLRSQKLNLQEDEVNKLALIFKVKNFILSQKTNKLLENVITVSKGCLLFFNKVGIRWWNETKNIIKDIYVVEAPLNVLESSFIPGVDIEVRHATSVKEILEIKSMFSKSGINIEEIPMDARYLLAIDSLSLKIIGGIWYQVNNKISAIGDVVKSYEISDKNIKKYLVASMLNQLIFDKIESISLIGENQSIKFIESILSEIIIKDEFGRKKIFNLVSSSVRKKALLKISSVPLDLDYINTIDLEHQKSA